MIRGPWRSWLGRAVAAAVFLCFAGAGPAATEIVVARISPGGGAEAAGLEPGDVLADWRTAGDEPGRSGTFANWIELRLLEVLESGRGAVEVTGWRGGEPLAVTLANREWRVEARPQVDAATLERLADALADPEAEATARGLAQEIDVPDGGAWVLAEFARARGEAGNWPAAAAIYVQASSAMEGATAAELLRRSGLALEQAGQLEAAEQRYGEALAQWRSVDPEGLGAAELLSDIGNVRGRQLRLAEAAQSLDEACAIRRRLAPEGWLLDVCLNDLGVISGRRNDLAEAEALFLESIELKRRRGEGLHSSINNLAIVAHLRGDSERAESYGRQALELYRQEGDPMLVAAGATNLAAILCGAQRHDAGLELLAEAFAVLAEQAPESIEHANVLINQGLCLHSAERNTAAAEALEAALEALGGDGDTGPHGTAYHELGAIARDRDDLDEAATRLERALAIRGSLQPDTGREAYSAAALAGVRAAQERAVEAEALFQRAIGAVEALQRRIGGGDRGLVAFRDKFAEIYRAYIDFLIEQGRGEEAYEIYERSRAEALRALTRQRDLAFDDLLPEALAGERRRLAGRIESTYGALARLPGEATTEREAKRLELEALHAERDALAARMRASVPRLAAVEAPPALAPQAIRAALESGDLLLGYNLGEEAATVFVVVADGPVRVVPLPAASEEISEQAGRWAELVVRPRAGAELTARTERLTELLLAPVAETVAGARRLIVVPDGALHDVAFAALFEPGDAERRRLIEARPVVRAVSGSVWASSASTPSSTSARAVVAFGDPAYPDEGVAAFRRNFGRLPATRAEALVLAEVFGERATVHLDEAATEPAARRALPDAGIAHFACHAVIDESLPLDSALLLSPSAGDEGLLQAWEITEDLELNADLVVLSACDTARGGERAGEGVIGLVRALQIAGARSVIASLWTVADASTAELMRRFYTHLGDGVAADEALRRAQVALIREPVPADDGPPRDYSHPRHWAPFVLIGRPAG